MSDNEVFGIFYLILGIINVGLVIHQNDMIWRWKQRRRDKRWRALCEQYQPQGLDELNALYKRLK